MSKQSKAKEFQMYIDKCIPMVCGNCTSFTSDKVQTCEPTTWKPEGWWSEKNMRCSIGGFAVKKTGTCNLHTFAPPNALANAPASTGD